MRTRFVGELQLLHRSFIGMGELTLDAVSHALDCLSRNEGASYERATHLESAVDDRGRKVHDRALEILVLKSPVAEDARLVTGILESSVELEQIADYAYEIAGLAFRTNSPSIVQFVSEVVTVGAKVRELLVIGIDSWRHPDRELTRSVRSKQSLIREQTRGVSASLDQLISDPGNVHVYVNLVLVCRHFERITRHVYQVAEHAAAAAPTEHNNDLETGRLIRSFLNEHGSSTLPPHLRQFGDSSDQYR